MPKKQSDGRYRAKITIGHTADGKPVTKYVSGKTKREMEEAKAAARAYYVDGAERRDDVLFGEYAVQWYKAYKEPTLGDSSRNDYMAVINNLLLPAFEGRMLRAITPVDLQMCLNEFGGKSKTRITLVKTIMTGVFGSAYNEGILTRDPSVRLVKPEAKPSAEKRAFTKQERNSIEELFATHENGRLLAVLYYLGLRRGEALALQWGDFDWKGNLVHITKDVDFQISRKEDPDAIGDVKTEAAARDVTVPAALRELLHPLRGLPHVYLFTDQNGNTMSKSTFEDKWIELMTPLGWVEPKKNPKGYTQLRQRYRPTITPHYFRHNYVTMLYEAGVDPLIVMRLVGHADYRTTANIYTHLNNMHQAEAKGKIDAVFSKKKVARKLPSRKI